MVTTALVIGAVASVAASAISASGASKAAATTAEAAELQSQVARELHQHWKAYYEQCDIKNITEVCTAPVYSPEYQVVEGRVRLEALRTVASNRDKARRTQDIYNVGASCQTSQYLAGVEAMMLTDSANYAYRWERTNVQQREQLRIANRFKGLTLGRNLLSQSMAASALAAAISGRVAALQGQAAQNWATLASYLTSERGAKQANDAWEIFKREFGIGASTPMTNEAGGPFVGINQEFAIDSPAQEGVGGAEPDQIGSGGANSDQASPQSTELNYDFQ
jgi:hypothetical protein